MIDAHSHYMPPEVGQNTMFFKVGWSDVDRQLNLMDENDVEKAVLLYPTSDAHLTMGGWANVCKMYNKAISDVVKGHSGRFIGGGILPADEPELFESELSRIQDLGLKILSLASSYEGKYLDDESFDVVYEFAAKYNMPIHVHSQIINPIGVERLQDPLLSPVLQYVFDISVSIGRMMMNGTFDKFPEVTFIFAHYGGVLPLLKERFDNTYAMLRRREFVKDLGKAPSEFFKNIYFDTAGSNSNASLQSALELVSADHIMFGSDFPANQSYSASIDAIKKSPLSKEDVKLVLESNVLKLL